MNLSRRQFAGLTLSAAAVSMLGIQPTLAADSARKGAFTGLSNHITTGAVSVVKKGDKTVVVLGKDFSFDGAPDPKLAFGTNGKYVKGTIIQKILPKENWTGASEHVVPAGIDVSKFDEVYVWCEQFNVPLGVAKIK